MQNVTGKCRKAISLANVIHADLAGINVTGFTGPLLMTQNVTGKGLEAAIQSIHAGRAQTGSTDWKQIALLYEGLVRIAPGIGSLVGRAVALAQAGTPADGFAALEKISADLVVNYQPYWAARGHLLHLLNRNGEAEKAFTRAASLTDDAALREYLFKRSAECV